MRRRAAGSARGGLRLRGTRGGRDAEGMGVARGRALALPGAPAAAAGRVGPEPGGGRDAPGPAAGGRCRSHLAEGRDAESHGVLQGSPPCRVPDDGARARLSEGRRLDDGESRHGARGLCRAGGDDRARLLRSPDAGGPAAIDAAVRRPGGGPRRACGAHRLAGPGARLVSVVGDDARAGRHAVRRGGLQDHRLRDLLPARRPLPRPDAGADIRRRRGVRSLEGLPRAARARRRWRAAANGGGPGGRLRPDRPGLAGGRRDRSGASRSANDRGVDRGRDRRAGVAPGGRRVRRLRGGGVGCGDPRRHAAARGAGDRGRAVLGGARRGRAGAGGPERARGRRGRRLCPDRRGGQVARRPRRRTHATGASGCEPGGRARVDRRDRRGVDARRDSRDGPSDLDSGALVRQSPLGGRDRFLSVEYPEPVERCAWVHVDEGESDERSAHAPDLTPSIPHHDRRARRAEASSRPVG